MFYLKGCMFAVFTNAFISLFILPYNGVYLDLAVNLMSISLDFGRKP